MVTERPFRHVVFDGYWDAELLDSVIAEFPDVADRRLRRFDNERERKLHGDTDTWGPSTIWLFKQIEKLGDRFSEIFGIPGLIMKTVGGGYHCIEPGGFLDVHTDFSDTKEHLKSKERLYRRLNLLIYLNRDWQDEGGRLELWDGEGRPTVAITPEFNRMVVFETSATSWHGHPKPASRVRRSVAAYFFTREKPEGYVSQSTVFYPRLGTSHG